MWSHGRPGRQRSRLAFSAHQLEKVFDVEIARPAVFIESPDLTCRDLVALKRIVLSVRCARERPVARYCFPPSGAP
jgi:hypothetical protein